MGNFFTIHCFKRGKSKLKHRRPNDINTNLASHEGIKTVGVQKFCEFSTNSVLRVCIVTWNMNGKVDTQDLAKLVGGDRKFDLFVVGLQEVPRCNIVQLLQESLVETHRWRPSDIETSVSDGQNEHYIADVDDAHATRAIIDLDTQILLGESTMQSLQLFVFGPKNYELFFKEIRVDKYSVGGFGGLIGRKKGAVAISIRFKGIRLVFISCHLSAHARNVEERNSQLRHISDSLFSENQNQHTRPSQITVWLGDLNYRIQGIDTHPVRNLIQKDLHSLLTSKDQLLQEAERGEIFNGYCEGTLAFKPTYKYNIGSSNYDTSHKVRVPSWTDRILFKIEKYGDIDAILHSYESIDCIHSSDHKPVKALLCLNIHSVESPTVNKEAP